MSSRAQGVAVLTAASCGVGLALFAYSRDAFVLLVWALGAAALWWVARKSNKIDNPSPPPPMRVATDAISQVSFIEDPDKPGHWIVNHTETGTS